MLALLLLVTCLSTSSHLYGLDLTPIQQDLLKIEVYGSNHGQTNERNETRNVDSKTNKSGTEKTE